MGWMDRLRTMFGGSTADRPHKDDSEVREVREELATERVEHDFDRDRDEAAERRIDTPTSLED